MNARYGLAAALALAVLGGMVVYFTTRTTGPRSDEALARLRVDAGVPAMAEAEAPEEPSPTGAPALDPALLAPSAVAAPEVPTAAPGPSGAAAAGTVPTITLPTDGTPQPAASAEETARNLVVLLDRRREELTAQMETAAREGDETRRARLERELGGVTRAAAQARVIAGIVEDDAPRAAPSDAPAGDEATDDEATGDEATGDEATDHEATP